MRVPPVLCQLVPDRRVDRVDRVLRRLAPALLLPALIGCGGKTEALEARVGRLEQEIAELKGAQKNSSPSRTARSGCKRVLDTDFPDNTAFRYAVDYELGATNVKTDDQIVINEVRGTEPSFEVGGIYLVKGRYTLASAPNATLLLSVTATERGEGCTSGNGRASVQVDKGAGVFELAAPIPYPGQPHVTFYVNGANAGGVYFGKDRFLKK